MTRATTRLRSLLGALGVAAVLPLIAIAVDAVGSASQERIAIGFFINLIVVLGLQVFTGNSGVVNLGHVSFMGIGAYATAVLATPPIIKQTVIPEAPFGLPDVEVGVLSVAIIAVIITAVLAWVSGVAVTRQVGISATIASLALLVVVHTVLLNWRDLTRGARAFYGIPIETTLFAAVAVATVIAVLARLFRDSTVGLQLRAGGEDSLAAAAMGVHIRRLRLLAWVVGGVFVGIAGVLYAFFLGTISPDAFYFHATFLTLAMLLLGGMRSVSGAVVGSIFVTLGFEMMRIIERGDPVLFVDPPRLPGLTDFFLGLVIVLVMTLRPEGLVGDEELDEALPRSIARLRAWWRARQKPAGLPEVTGAPASTPAPVPAVDEGVSEPPSRAERDVVQRAPSADAGGRP